MTAYRVILAPLALALVFAQRAPEQIATLRAPKFAVGFRSVPDSQRPPGLAVWYPAVATPGARTMTPRDYLAYSVDTTLPGSRRTFMAGIARSYAGTKGIPSGPAVPDLPDSVARDFLSLHTSATLNAVAAPGRFPAVIFTIPLGGTGAADNFPLAEELAAQGTVVVSGPPLGTLPANTSLDEYLKLIIASARRVLDGALGQSAVDRSRVIALDPSGSAALMLQIEHPRFRGAIVFDEMPFVDSHRVAIEQASKTLDLRILYFPLGDPPPNEAVMSRFPSERLTTARIPGASHGLMAPIGALFQRRASGSSPAYDVAVARILDFVAAQSR